MRKLVLFAAQAALLLTVNPVGAQFCPGGTGYVFDDVLATDPFCGYITWVAQNDISLGCQVIDANHRLYCPNDAVSRSQMSAFVTRMAANSSFTQGGNAFGATAALGTLDTFPLEIYAGNWRVMRFEPGAFGPNVIGGFHGNAVQIGTSGMTVAGGGTAQEMCIDPATGTYASVCANRAGSWIATVGGGAGNIAQASMATVAGGFNNVVGADAGYSFSGHGAFIGGGSQNTAHGIFSTIAGGLNNVTVGSSAFPNNGQAIGGGIGNVAQGGYAAIPGGSANAAGGDYSFAAGRRAKAMAQGCFTWGDSTDADVTCATNDTFVVRSSGGFVLGTNAAMTTGCSIAPGGGAWSCTSSRDAKSRFTAIDSAEILLKVAALPIATWAYRTDSAGTRHLGPTAEDFHEAFRLGDSATQIGLLDASGVALAAVQGLNAKLEKKIAEQAQEIDAQRTELAGLKRAVELLMAKTAPPTSIARE